MIIAGDLLSYLGSQMNFASSVLNFIEEKNTKCSKKSNIKNVPFVTGM